MSGSSDGGSLPRLRYMADQIARNFMAMGHDKAILATADHIDMFWDPRMKAMIFADDRSQLGAVAGPAIEYLASGQHPEHQTRATIFNKVDEAGHSDGA